MIRYILPTRMDWQGEEPGKAQALALERALLNGLRQGIERYGKETGTKTEIQVQVPDEPGGRSSHLLTGSEEFIKIPSYDDGGNLVKIPVQEVAGRPTGDASTIGPADRPRPWSEKQALDHILATFGTYGPVGKIRYGVQTEDAIFFIEEVVNGKPITFLFQVLGVEKDVRGTWKRTGEQTMYSMGRLKFSVTSRAKEMDMPGKNIGWVADLSGSKLGKEIYTDYEVGFQLVFDVPTAPKLGAPETGPGGLPLGEGILPGQGGMIFLHCNPLWDTAPLTDPAFAGISDTDLFYLFLNLCNNRAIQNLNASEKYVRENLVRRYAGPGGSTRIFSDLSSSNIDHILEDLELLRISMLELYRLDQEIRPLQAELDTLLITPRQTTGQFQSPFGFGAPMKASVFWPTQHQALPADEARAAELTEGLHLKWDQVRTLDTVILKLVINDPILTQFIEGLVVEGRVVEVPSRDEVKNKLSSITSKADAQKIILQKLNDILLHIAQARDKLCREPERILDVPLVYEAVQKDLAGINQHFDKIVADSIAHHQKLEAWTDIGLSAVGLVLFVGGLIVSAAGGPAGIIGFLGLSGTAVGGVIALRSIDKAIFTTGLSEATLERGGGLITLEAAKEARFWASVDSLFVMVDAATQGVKAARAIVKARKAEALAKVIQSSERVDEALEASGKIPFDEFMKRARPKGDLELSAEQLEKLTNLPEGISGNQISGAIAEEVARKTILAQGDYLPLATQFQQANLKGVGIDLLFVRRRVFERVFGKINDIEEASKILSKADPEQQKKLVEAILKSRDANDLVSIEVKFSRFGEPIEELLKGARQAGALKGVQQNKEWYKDLLKHMREAAEPEIKSTARLLEDIIGASAQNVNRLGRFGIVMESDGAFKLTRLSDDLINAGNRLRDATGKLKKTVGWLLSDLQNRKNKNVERLQRLLAEIQKDIPPLEAEVQRIKEAQRASEQIALLLERSARMLEQVDDLSNAARTPSVLEKISTANALARTYLQAVHDRGEALEKQYVDSDQAIRRYTLESSQDQDELSSILDELEWEEPGIKRRALEILSGTSVSQDVP